MFMFFFWISLGIVFLLLLLNNLKFNWYSPFIFLFIYFLGRVHTGDIAEIPGVGTPI